MKVPRSSRVDSGLDGAGHREREGEDGTGADSRGSGVDVTVVPRAIPRAMVSPMPLPPVARVAPGTR